MGIIRYYLLILLCLGFFLPDNVAFGESPQECLPVDDSRLIEHLDALLFSQEKGIAALKPNKLDAFLKEVMAFVNNGFIEDAKQRSSSI